PTRRPPIADWLESIDRELGLVATEQGWDAPLDLETLYIGGGTPSLMGRGAMAELRDRLARHARHRRPREWTVEAHTGHPPPAPEPQHSWLYGLTAESTTPLGRWVREGRESMPDDDAYAAQYRLAAERLPAAGFEHYEVSNFSRAGRASRHNIVYWTGKAY